MSNRKNIVDDGRAVCNSEQDDWRDRAPSSAEIRDRIQRQVDDAISLLRKHSRNRTFGEIEKAIISFAFALGRLFHNYFLAWRHEHSDGEVKRMKTPGTRVRPAQPRLLGTYFGKVRYWRTYLRRRGGSGVYPLDIVLGLPADGFSFLVMGLAARLSTMVSYDGVAGLLMNFLSWSPSKMSIEKTVLGLGRYTADWFEQAPPPKGDGEVLIIQVDSKATPTATDSELEKRRRKRGPRPAQPSPRHRGREKRRRRGSKPRRKKGDKSKNGRAVTLVVMYTLREAIDENGRRILQGPINRRFYGSYAAKRHAFAIARREANKRGFGPGSGKRIQIVTDGDEDLTRYAGEFFPGVIHTLDVMHVMEHIWEAGGCLYKEGSQELTAWVKKMENLIYRGKAIEVVGLLANALAGIPKTGPGNKGKRERLESNRDYLFNRIDQMNYAWLRRQDLELASGSVEGAVNHVIAKRFDSGGMRWIRERAEALLQLRCIDLNGDWEAFMAFVERKATEQARRERKCHRILTWRPAPLPQLGLTA
jgi:hypothetical protein